MQGLDLSLITLADSYKFSHHDQYPPGTNNVSSYIEDRGGPFPTTRFFGLQGMLKAWFQTPVTMQRVKEEGPLIKEHCGSFNEDGWKRIVDKHGGYPPIEIEAVPEGLDVPTGNVLFQVRATDPELPWTTSYFESLEMQLWYPKSVCTLSAHIKSILMEMLEESCDNPQDAILWLLHDFGFRGASSPESAAVGGLAHLVNFRGTDTFPAIMAGRAWYHEPMAGRSIPAGEHSTVTAWGRYGEPNYLRNLIRTHGGPGKVVAWPVDSYDMEYAIETVMGDECREEIINSGTKVVARPDSGDPRIIVPRALQILDRCFGGYWNHKGYRVLNPCVGAIQGDGMKVPSIRETGAAILAAKFSAENVPYGMGGGLLHSGVSRDMQQTAMKGSAVEIEEIWHDMYKEPKTDPRKNSKRGRLALTYNGNEWSDHKIKTGFETVRLEHLAGRENVLRPVYRNGELLIDESLQTIRERAEKGL